MHLKFAGLGHRYSETEIWLFRQLDTIFAPRTMTAFVGPSGSGKSTLLDIAGQVLSPAEGQVFLCKDDDSLSPPVTSDFGWVLQSNTVLAGRTALDNAALGLLASGMSHRQARKRARTVLAELGLEHRLGAPVSELSGGEVQRVTIARCLLSPAPIILADEPTGQLDYASTRTVVAALRSAAEAGKIILLATHDPVVARECDRSLVIPIVNETRHHDH
ncbi:MAG: hypothetical protein B5766_01310 [Candidatus Lumbricidophila eiseniae]|uniref:ABC transporter domain-containing protein n=1 Tax=Candidatus Lumbricidiphila eiseniae TaxID=1969409 RepID=A0A2A6FU24_9MICO|nr:MAG: hypothetical protein B5766_01310 [Candidatus Lumbricidophila eiseniae]